MKLCQTAARAALALSCCVWAVFARGDGLIRDGIGPISTGRGGTNQAFADNSVVILDNPAAMVNVNGGGLAELGADTVITSVKYTDSYNSVYSKVHPSRGRCSA